MNNSDIQFHHSGGASNNDPELDLGGEISSFTISSTPLNNLFDDINSQQSREGLVDYRCFYVKNNHGTETLRNAKLWMNYSPGDCIVALGIDVKNEIQQVVVSSSGWPNEGNSFTVEVPTYSPSFVVDYDPNITKWVGNFQTAIRGVEGLVETRVTATGTVPDVTFTVEFGGHDKRNTLGQSRSRAISLIMVTNNLDNATPTPTAVQDGAPVNTTAPTIANKLTAPPSITFNYPLRGNPVELGNLRPGEYFPVWAKRTVPVGSFAKHLNNYSINIEGTFP